MSLVKIFPSIRLVLLLPSLSLQEKDEENQSFN